MNRPAKLLIAALFLSLIFVAAPAKATTPAEQIEETVRAVLAVVKNPSNTEEQRKKLLRETLMPRFDWFEMARRTLGKNWSAAAGREQEFVGTFAEFLGKAYVGNITSYKDEKIVLVQESIERNLAQVKTRIEPRHGEPTSVTYRMHRIQEEWKIYDVVIEDISLVGNYRAQFNRVLAKGSFDDLLRQMKEK